MSTKESAPSSPSSPRTPDFGNFARKGDGYIPGNAYCLASCAHLAYESQEEMERQTEQWGLTGFQFLGETEDIGAEEFARQVRAGKRLRIPEGAGTEGFIVRGKGFAIVCFRGTEEATDFLTDLNVKQSPDALALGQLHCGFAGALSQPLRAVLKTVVRALAEEGVDIWVTGHSLGGALATLAAAELVFDGLDVQGVYTFGQPRVCCPDFAEAYEKKLGDRHFRFVNNNDIVPEVPPKKVKKRKGDWYYRHVGQRIYIKTSRQLTDDIGGLELTIDRVAGYAEAALEGDFKDGVTDHRMVNYLAALAENPSLDPKEARQTVQEIAALLEKEPVEFDSYKAVIKAEGKTTLDQVADLLRGAPAGSRFKIEGHTDSTGSRDLNKPLSLDRAEAVRDHLVEKGLASGRFAVEGCGSSRPAPPAESNETPEDRERNRRVEIHLLE